MKIIIIGAGISGLSSYLFLRKYLTHSASHEIAIYERRVHPSTADDSSGVGAEGVGLGILPNGMQVLYNLDPEVAHAVASHGFEFTNLTLCNAQGDILSELDTTGEGPQGFCVSISHHKLWKCLKDEFERREGGKDLKHAEIQSVTWDIAKAKALIHGPNLEEEADLVIGADGVNSTTRQGLFGPKKYPPRYSGREWVGGSVCTRLPDLISRKQAWVVALGRHDYFSYFAGAPASEGILIWMYMYSTAGPRSAARIKTGLRDRHYKWNGSKVQDVIVKTDAKAVHRVKVMPELPTWGKNGIVLVGDAAHAMSPTTGQGASQGLEDAQTLSLLLARHLERRCHNVANDQRASERFAIAPTLEVYYAIRHRRTRQLAKLGQVFDTVPPYVVGAFLRVCKIFPATSQVGHRLLVKFYQWDANEEVRKAFENVA